DLGTQQITTHSIDRDDCKRRCLWRRSHRLRLGYRSRVHLLVQWEARPHRDRGRNLHRSGTPGTHQGGRVAQWASTISSTPATLAVPRRLSTTCTSPRPATSSFAATTSTGTRWRLLSGVTRSSTTPTDSTSGRPSPPTQNRNSECDTKSGHAPPCSPTGTSSCLTWISIRPTASRTT